jgi:N-acetylneuraminic acid mutarotase
VGALAGLVLAVGSAQAAPLAFEERVACERALEEVRWDRRVWPATNPGSKPALGAVLKPGVLEERVRDSLLKSTALDAVWSRPLTNEQLQAEIDHMARNTRSPEILRELWAALGNDPSRIAECLARPQLADRLVRDWYAFDTRFHDPVRDRANEELERYGKSEWMRLLGGDYSESVWMLDVDGAGRPTVTLDERRFDEHGWSAATGKLAETLGMPLTAETTLEGRLPVNHLSPLREDARRFFVVAVLESEAGRLRVAEVTWPKVPFHEWWSEIRGTLSVETMENLGEMRLPEVADSCVDDTWQPMRDLPDAKAGHVAVWTGSEMLVWGNRDVFGSSEPGARYDPAIDVWHPISTTGHPEGNMVSVGAWTGTEMLIWGGFHGTGSVAAVDTGARYDPISDAWTPTSTVGAPSPRGLHSGVWTGSELIVWGGCGVTTLCSAYLDTGGRYNPSTDSWTATDTVGAPSPRQFHTSVWTGSEMVVWAGEGPGVFNTLNDGARYAPATDSWTAMTNANAPDARIFHSAISTGPEMLVFGGCNTDGCFDFMTAGARYDLAGDTWSPISAVDEPSRRYRHSAIWTGDQMIVYGGCTHDECSFQSSAGGRYDPATDTWTATSLTGSSSRASHTAIWTGTEMIIWGGCSGGECQTESPTGGRYDPATDSWVSMSVETGPVARINHAAVWTGAEMILWGGAGASNDGARYDPATDHWFSVNPIGGKGRDRPTAIWTGTEMLVWAGSQAGVGASNTGERYDVISDSWTNMSTAGAPLARLNQSGVWTGTEMIVWGGCTGCITPYFNTGGRYDPATDSWTATSTAGAPLGRIATSAATEPLAIWTGSEMIVWGGWPASGDATDTGGRYDPVSDTWTPTRMVGAPSARRHHTLEWTGDEMIVWGGEDSFGSLGDGASYDPTTNSWSTISGVGAPTPRFRHAAEWTGDEMIVWGGTANDENFDTGGRYDPLADSWSPTSTGAFVPFPRHLTTSVWTGSQMLIWGGAWNVSGQTGTGAGYCAQTAAVACGDLSQLRARCQANGRLQARVTLLDTSHDGESIVFDVDGQLFERPIVNGRASLSIPGQGGTGQRTIAVAEPAACLPPRTVTCN